MHLHLHQHLHLYLHLHLHLLQVTTEDVGPQDHLDTGIMGEYKVSRHVLIIKH